MSISITNQIDPRGFTSEVDFTDAFIAQATAQIEPVTRFASFETATARRVDTLAIALEAREEAREIWRDFVEDAVENFERGVGPAWD